MVKKYIAGISIVLVIAVFVVLGIVQENKSRLVNPVSSTMAEEIWGEKERVDRFEFRSLLCNGTQVPLDYVEKTFYVPVDMESDEWETLKFSSGDPEYLLCFSEDFTELNKKELIASGESIEFLVYNAAQFSTYHMIFTGLPVIDIATTAGLEGQENIVGEAVFYDTDFSMYGTSYSEFNGHVRGNTSTLYPKKGYKINLTKQIITGATVKNKLPLFGMREDDDWMVYALYNDGSKLRTRLAAELWDEFGSKEIAPNSIYNTSMKYVELVIDEAYYGLYIIMEPIDAKQLNLNAEDYLYKREQPADLTKEGFVQVERGTVEAMGFEIKSGELSENAWLPLADLSEVINMSDAEFEKQIGSIADMDNAMRLWLYIQVIVGVDQGSKNVFYVARKSGDSYRFTFAPWDLDLTWGNTSSSDEPHYTVFTKERLDKVIRWQPGNRLIELNVEGIADEMQTLYTQLREGVLSDQLMEERMKEINHILRDSGAYARETARWPEAAAASDYTQVLEYARERLAYLDTALFDLENFLNEK